MIYIMVIILSIIVGLLRGGELERIFKINIQAVYLFAIALLMRSSIWILEWLNSSFLHSYSHYIMVVSYLLLILATIWNIKLPGFRYIFLGIFLNTLVIIANGGKMPVLLNQQILQNLNSNNLVGGKNMVHTLMNQNTLFSFLGDVIPLPAPFPDACIISAGDIMIFIGFFVFIQRIMMQEDILKSDNTEIFDERVTLHD